MLEDWSTAKPAFASLTLIVVYLTALAALVAVLAASALNTVIGTTVVVLFGVTVLVSIAVAVYVVTPERSDPRVV